jgi:intracellular proteinase inhibitor BsuPI
MTRKPALGFLLLGVLILPAACSDSSTPAEPRPARARLTLTLPSSTVEPGQKVPVSLTLLNDGDEPLQLTFGSSCQVDLVVESGGSTVWNLMSNVLCLDQVTSSTLQPSQQVVYNLEWDQTKNGGGGAQLGTYTMRGILLAGERPQSAPATLTIRSSG